MYSLNRQFIQAMLTKLVIVVFLTLNLTAITISCNSFVAVDVPPNQLSADVVFEDDVTALSTLTGIYSQMMETTRRFAAGGITFYLGLSADELTNYSTQIDQIQFYDNNIFSTNAINQNLWADLYKYIYSSNLTLETLKNSDSITSEVKIQIEGEAKFIRGFCYFYLVNLYGSIPLLLTSNWQTNSTAKKEDTDLIYLQIIKDLEDSYNLLRDNYHFSNGERIRPNKYAAASMLARVYLYLENWEMAIYNASKIIDQNVYQLVKPADVFQKNSLEAIWQLMPVQPNFNTPEGASFILISRPSLSALDEQFLNGFEEVDARRNEWVDSITVSNDVFYFPNKYRVRTGSPVTEYSMVLRLAEQYLIRSEAYARQGQLSNALSDLNQIRDRSSLPPISLTQSGFNQEYVLSLVANEKRIEFLTEWGHRWFDLKRTNKLRSTLSDTKNINLETFSEHFPIPDREIQLNPNLR